MAEEQSGGRAGRLVVLVVSPHAGKGEERVPPAKLLEAAGVVVAEQMPVSDLDHNLPRGAEWRARGIQAVVAAGGDGTVGAVATQLVDTDLPLGILPLGTSNDCARALGIPLTVSRACEVVAYGEAMEIDVGRAVPAVTEPFALSDTPQHGAQHGTDGQAARAASGAFFLHTLTLGLNVEFARLATDVANRRRWGGLTYVASAIEALSRFQSVLVTLRLAGVARASAEDETPETTGTLVVTHDVVEVAAMNLPVFGGGLNLRVPDVSGRDRLLDFLLFDSLEDVDPGKAVESWLGTIERHVARRRVAQHTSARIDRPLFTLPGLLRYQAREAVIETPEPMDVTLDGEVRARTPVRIGLAPAPIRVLVPARVGAPRGQGAPGLRQAANGTD